jgi:asparagine synthase (glutamine-hydrolysing)
VEKLPAGHYRLLRHDAPPAAPVQWWDISFADREPGNTADLGAHLLHRLREAVTSRMMADVPLGAFLSGGVDSSSVVALMAEASTDPVKTCSIGFDVQALDETAYADKVAALFGTDHCKRVVASDDFALIDRLAGMFDEPFADASALPTFRVCELAREHVTVALSGDGADEALPDTAGRCSSIARNPCGRCCRKACERRCSARWGGSGPRRTGRHARCGPRQTFLNLARSGEEGYARSLSVTPVELRNACMARISCGCGAIIAPNSLCGDDAPGAGAFRAGPGAIRRSQVLSARRHSDQGGPDEHGGQP